MLEASREVREVWQHRAPDQRLPQTSAVFAERSTSPSSGNNSGTSDREARKASSPSPSIEACLGCFYLLKMKDYDAILDLDWFEELGQLQGLAFIGYFISQEQSLKPFGGGASASAPLKLNTLLNPIPFLLNPIPFPSIAIESLRPSNSCIHLSEASQLGGDVGEQRISHGVRGMAVTFYDVSSQAGLKKLDEYLLTRSYISGYQASKDDIVVHAALTSPLSSEYVNVSRWYKHIDALLRLSGVSAEGSGVTIEGSAPCEAPVSPPVADAKMKYSTIGIPLSSNNLHLLVSAGKSSVLLDVKPWDDETDMQKLEEAVRSIHMEGLLWGASKLVPVGYGIKKLQIMMTIVDDLVSVDTLIEEHLTAEPANEHIQSCDIVAFNKICKYNCFLKPISIIDSTIDLIFQICPANNHKFKVCIGFHLSLYFSSDSSDTST
ncbi:hypothetical protein Taro_024189 [Colocasia esculenta]|uniref:Translation elongation factor EF1B beta/delta subunit guanine nucleotide exchange domain-containing protein n=1 Tax=Colocasia esculenta TaxID=4460 RepID=A0A843VGR0_COLES|nr:hypothetical protein [Colocasia esculenta]